MNTDIVLSPRPTDQIIVVSPTNNRANIVPPDASGHTKHRLEHFVAWLDTNGNIWFSPDLAAYRDFLMSPGRTVERSGKTVYSALSPRSTAAHLSTIRGRYNLMLDDNPTRDRLYALAPSDDALERKAFVDEILTRLRNAVHPKAAKVKVIKKQDEIDADHLRLTKAQADSLIDAPWNLQSNTPLQILRDTALIGLLLCTGLREAELCALDVKDLRQRVNGELVLHVRDGKGAKARAVPYGDLQFSLSMVDDWLEDAGIESGPVFRGFWKGGNKVRPSRLTNNAVNAILDQYLIVIDGQRRRVKPHDCRRTYARRLWEAGVDPVIIQQNLGHADLKTTMHYIGDLKMDQRRPPAVYSQPDMARRAMLRKRIV